MNAKKYKVMVGSGDGNFNLWKVTLSVMCTIWKRWINKWYSGGRGNLLLVSDGFMCNHVHDNSNTGHC